MSYVSRFLCESLSYLCVALCHFLFGVQEFRH